LQSKSELAKTIARLERTLLTDTVDDEARKIDRVIDGLTKRRCALFDKAFPISAGANGACRDAGALDAVGAIDREIADLRLAKSNLLSGEIDDEPPTIAAPTSRHPIRSLPE
jgi:hypothetical protein